MKPELADKIKQEALYLLYLFIAGLIVFKIIFYKEAFLVVLRTVSAFFFLFILPGFSLMYYWHEKLEFLERFIIGVAVSASIVGVSSYYLGLLGLNIKYHGFLIPIGLLVISGIIIYRKK